MSDLAVKIDLLLEANNKAFDDIQSKIKNIEKNTVTAGKNAGKAYSLGFIDSVKASALGNIIANAVGQATSLIANGIKKGLGTVFDFNAQLSNIKALTGSTAQEMDKVRSIALQLGKDTKFSGLEAAQGIEELLKAGVRIEDIMGGAAKGALDLAAAGGIAVADAAEIASTALNAFAKDGLSVTQAADILAGAANASATSVGELRFGLSQASAVASGVGMNFKDTATALGLFANNGLKGSDAGTSLKTMLLNLQPSTKEQKKLFDQLGITTNGMGNQFFTAEGKVKDLASVSQVLQDKLKGMTDQQRLSALETLFGTDAIRAANILYKEGAKGVQDLNKEMTKFTAADVAKERMNNLKGSLDNLKSTIETQMIVALGSIEPILKPVIDSITLFINSLDGKKVSDFISYIGSMSGSFFNFIQLILTNLQPVWDNFVNVVLPKILPIIDSILGYFNWAFPEIQKLFQYVIDTVITPLWNKLVYEILPLIKPAIDSIFELFKNLWPFIEPFVKYFVDSIGNYLFIVGDVFKGLVEIITGVAKTLNGLLTGDFKTFADGIGSLFGGIASVVAGVFKGIVNSIINSFNLAINSANSLIDKLPEMPGGGKVAKLPTIPKLATGTNFVPKDMLAFIHKGEMVVPAKYNPNNPTSQVWNNSNNTKTTNIYNYGTSGGLGSSSGFAFA